MHPLLPSDTRPAFPDVIELIAVRHGQSIANAAFAAAEANGAHDSGITVRDHDVPLSPLGRRQAAHLGVSMATWPAQRRPDVVLCSPYLRARQTLEIASTAATGRGVSLPSPCFDIRLRDRVMGELELLTSRAIEARFPLEARRRIDVGEFHYRPPGGESFDDVAVRLNELLCDLHKRHPGNRILLVAHDSVVLMLRRLIEGLSWQEITDITRTDPVSNASVTRWRKAGKMLRLVDYNQIRHLRTLS